MFHIFKSTHEKFIHESGRFNQSPFISLLQHSPVHYDACAGNVDFRCVKPHCVCEMQRDVSPRFFSPKCISIESLLHACSQDRTFFRKCLCPSISLKPIPTAARLETAILSLVLLTFHQPLYQRATVKIPIF